MHLNYYIDENGNKIYTLKEKIREKETKPAHYKFIKVKPIKEK